MYINIHFIVLILWLLVIFLYGTYRTGFDEGWNSYKKKNIRKIKSCGYAYSGKDYNLGEGLKKAIESQRTFDLKHNLVSTIPFRVKTWKDGNNKKIEVSLLFSIEKENEKEG